MGEGYWQWSSLMTHSACSVTYQNIEFKCVMLLNHTGVQLIIKKDHGSLAIHEDLLFLQHLLHKK
jgi:hypothetical protein